MKSLELRRSFQFGLTTILIGTMGIAGCSHVSHPDDKSAVYQSLIKNNLRSVVVSQNRESGVITLSGIVGATDAKSEAETLAKEVAPGYTINNQVQVQIAGLQSLVKKAKTAEEMDKKIEKDFEALVNSKESLHNLSIYWKAKNRVLILKGTVRTNKQWRDVQDLAKQVPNVERVLNYIDVGDKEHPAANS